MNDNKLIAAIVGFSVALGLAGGHFLTTGRIERACLIKYEDLPHKEAVKVCRDLVEGNVK